MAAIFNTSFKNQQRQLSPASILFLGLGWFPNIAGGLERYIYELTQQLVNNQDQINLCGIDLPNISINNKFRLTNLCQSNLSTLHRLYSVRKTLKNQPR
ncbi:COG0438: Glycosyltransferase [Richelia intracellularis HH01]|uniref:COG0438: Glycosyltransferase n=1 Tax=Richelia intracellularis HH01 TaxID=1165094 RepID=M1WZE9_9NOST|nr:COG0438: Glycosyltransferase [Richelia intracellularis HH01]